MPSHFPTDRPSPVPIFLLFVGVVAFVVGACVLGFAR